MRIGFIGLGSMGAGMAANLIKGGHEVTVWNRSAEAAKALEAQGAKVAASAAEAANGAEVVHNMLANDAAVREVILGSVLPALDRGAIHVNHATISVGLAEELAEAHEAKGIGFVAAPVFGRPEVAAAGHLNMLASGKPEHVAKVQPLLELLAAKVWPLGDDPIRATVVKIGGNFLIGAAIESMAEASALTRAHGVEAKDFLEIMQNTLFSSPIYKVYGGMIAENRYEPVGFKLSLGFKDVGLARAAAEAKRVPMPVASVLHDALLESLNRGDGDIDWAGLARVAAARANLKD